LGISLGSINSGLPKDIVEQIISAEKIPIQKMEQKKVKIQEKTALVNELSKHIEQLNEKILKNSNLKEFGDLKIATDESIITASADKKVAYPGDYRFEVLKLAQKSSALTSGFPDKDKSYVGVGFLEFFLPNGESKSIFIDKSDATLSGVAKLINSDPELGMKANIVNDGTGSEDPWRLLLSFDESGRENRAEFPYLYFVDGERDFYIDKEREAENGVVRLDGFLIETPSNQIQGLLPGVSIELMRADEGKEFNLKISNDNLATSQKIYEIVENINAILKFINVQNTMDQNTDTSRTLGGDVLLQNIEHKLRGLIFKPIDTDFGQRRISDLGITFQKNGLLAVDQNKFETKITGNLKEVSQILYGKNKQNVKTPGFITNLEIFGKETLKIPSGTIPLKKKTLRDGISSIDKKIENTDRHIAQKESNLRNKFARLEKEISRIKGQGSEAASIAGGKPGP
jgi:flagellar hook-associated protein 2